MAPQLTIMQRLENVEKTQQNGQQMTEGMFNQFRTALTTAMETLDATMAVLSDLNPEVPVADKVQEKVKAKRHERLVAQSEQEKSQLEQLVKAGVVRVSETIAENSILVARIFDANGEVTGVGRTQLEVNRLNPSIRPNFLGQGVGYVYEAESKDKLEVLEVYEVVPQSAEAAAPGTPAEVTAEPPAEAQTPAPPPVALVETSTQATEG
jgi:hypothetical protein